MSAEPAEVRVRVTSILHEYTGGADELAARGRTVGAVLDDLESRHRGLRFRIVDEQDAIRPHIKIYVGRRQVQRLDARVPAGELLQVIQSLSGG